MEQVFPDEHWEYRDPEDLGFSKAKLDSITSHIIWVCPSLDLVVVESPSIWSSDDASEGLRKLIVEAYGK